MEFSLSKFIDNNNNNLYMEKKKSQFKLTPEKYGLNKL